MAGSDFRDPDAVNRCKRQINSERCSRHQHQLASKVAAIEIGGRIGFGQAASLRLRNCLVEGNATSKLVQDEVRGAVKHSFSAFNLVLTSEPLKCFQNGNRTADCR